MSTPFRAAAVSRYRAGRAQAAIPSLILPRPTAAASVLVLLLMLVLGLAVFVRIPQYAPGMAVVVQGRSGDPDGIYAAALLPAESLSRLRPGQAAYLEMGSDGTRLRSTTVAVEPDVISPDALAGRLSLGALGARAMFILGGPVAVAYAPLEPPNAASYLGSVVQANVEIGSRPVLALLSPFAGLRED